MEMLGRNLSSSGSTETADTMRFATPKIIDCAGDTTHERSMHDRKAGLERLKGSSEKIREALGDKKNTGISCESAKKPSRSVADRLRFRELSKPFEVYCDSKSSSTDDDQVNDKGGRQRETADEQFDRVDPDAGVEGFGLEDGPEPFEELVTDPECRLEIDRMFFDIIRDRDIVRPIFLDVVSEEDFEQIEKDSALPEEEFEKKFRDFCADEEDNPCDKEV